MSSMDFVLSKERILKIDPKRLNMGGSHRFILSAGHESMLQYSLLYATGWLEKSNLQSFRQLHSKTPGHPDFETKGVECATGPLGQGAAMSVGFAIGESHFAQALMRIFWYTGTAVMDVCRKR